MNKILVVEDEPVFLNLLRDQLTQKGFEVITAEDGEKGLEAAKKERPDLMLLDIRMPKMDGMTMLKMLREFEKSLPKDKQTKVILLTNLEPDEKITSEVVEAEPIYYCIKSETKLDDLMEKIDGITNQETVE